MSIVEKEQPHRGAEATNGPAASAEIVAGWLGEFGRAIEDRDAERAAAAFVSDGWWRDQLSFTWDLVTFYGSARIQGGLETHLATAGVEEIVLRADPEPQLSGDGTREWIVAFLTFRTAVGTGSGVVRLLRDDSGAWRAWTLLTSLTSLSGYGEAGAHWDELGSAAYKTAVPDRRRWHEVRAASSEFADGQQPTVLIIGAGHSGLGLAARLDRLNVSNLVVDRAARVGDNWRNRYASLQLHDPLFANHLPYLSFPAPSPWPLMLPKDKVAEWLEAYASLMDLKVWMNTEVADSAYNDESKGWTVRLSRGHDETRILHPRHVVVATGNSGRPFIPDFPGMEEFVGEIVHSAYFTDGTKYRGEKAIVIGTGNSGQDIAQDLWEQGAEPTLVQRSSTYVMSTEHGVPTLASHFAQGLSIEDADLFGASIALPLAMELDKQSAKGVAELDREMIEGLEEAGFKTNVSGSLSGGLTKAGGSYIDQGCAGLIVEGRVKVKHGNVQGLTRRHVVFDDGSTLEADLVVLATGFQNMRESARQIFGDEVAERCSPVWGMDEERGELRSVWRDSGHPRLWFHAGNFQWSRYYSRLLALQIKGIELGLYEQPSVRDGEGASSPAAMS